MKKEFTKHAQQSRSEMLAVIKTGIALHSIVTREDGLFDDYKEFLGAVQFLQLHGSSKDLSLLITELASVHSRVLKYIVEAKQIFDFNHETEAITSYLERLRSLARLSEDKIKKNGYEFDAEKKLIKEVHDPIKRKKGYARRHLFANLVISAFEFFTKKDKKRKNLLATRKKIAESLAIYFAPEMLDLKDSGKISQAIWTYLKPNKFKSKSNE